MKLKRYTLLVLFLLSFQISAQSQSRWSLEQCIEYALEHNLDIQRNQLQVEIQEANLLNSKARMLPSLNTNGNSIVNWGKAIDRYTNQFAETRTTSVNMSLQSSVTIFNGFQLLNTVKRNQLELSAQKYDLDYQKDMKAMEITTAFLQILYDQENLKNKQEQVRLTQMQVDRTNKLVEAGSVAKGDLFNIKSQLATEQAQEIDAENRLNLSYLNLKQLMYLPGDTNITIYAPEIELNEGLYVIQDPYLVYNYALDNRPEIKSAEIRVEGSKKDLSIAKGKASPHLSISAGLGSGYSGANVLYENPVLIGSKPTGNYTTSGDLVMTNVYDYTTTTKNWDDQIKDNNNYSVGFYLTIPIFNGLQTYTATSQSNIALQQAELQLEKSRLEMRQTIEQAYADARSALKSYEASKLQVDALQEAFSYAEQRYDAKMITAFEYNDAKIKLDIARSEMLNSKYNYVFRVKILDFYSGKPLSL